VIIEEIQMYEDNPIMHTLELMEEEMFGDTSLGWNIAGTRDTVSKITRTDLVSYMKRLYDPKRTVISIAGRFDEEAAVRLVTKRFGNKRRAPGRRGRPPKTLPSRAVRGPRLVMQEKETGQVQIAIGFPAYGYGDRRLPTALLLSTILGGTLSSRLSESVREKAGLCYAIHSSVTSYLGYGHFSIQSGLARDGVHKGLRLIMKELSRLKDRPVTTEELSRSKEYLKGRIMLSLEDSGRLANWYAKSALLTGSITAPEKRLAQLFRVTKDDIQKVAKNLFKKERLTMAVIGPHEDKDTYNAHASRL